MKKITNYICLTLILLNSIALFFVDIQKTTKQTKTNKKDTTIVYQTKKTYIASWYAKGKCKDGSRFTGRSWTCASNILPRGTILRIRFGSRCADRVRVNDYMAYPKQYRQIDCSKRVADYLGFTKQGIAKVEIEILYYPTR